MSLDAQTINSIYEKYLQRPADPSGLSHYAQYEHRSSVVREIIHSDEFKKSDVIVLNPQAPSAWKMCVLEEAKLIFVPIAKNAHTSILNALLNFKGIDWRNLPIADELIRQHGNDDDKIHYALSNNDTGLLLKDYSPELIDAVLRDPGYLRIAVFRDPVERLVSACNHFFIQEIDNPVARRHSQPILDSVGEKSDAIEPRRMLEYWLRKLMKFIMASKVADIDPHWVPQYDYVRSTRIDHILPIERLDVLDKIVASRSGRGLNIGRQNARNSKASNAQNGVGDELRNLIEEFYWIDRTLYETAKANVESVLRTL